MKFSENWLKQWVKYDLTTAEVMEQLTMLGLEVDGVEPAAGEFSGVVVAEITSCEKHPDADKLNICEVNAGDETLQIVCGAPNARAGLKTALSKVGAVLPGNFKIKKSKLRGVESNGMLCSEVELGISQESDGIIELPVDAPIGSDVGAYMKLNDQVIDIDLTPNRADCFCIRGVAREMAALNNLDVIQPEINQHKPVINDIVSVELKAPAQCPIYGSRIIKGIDNNQTTPLWIKECLRRSGIKSINPVVDVTNYVLLEMGQPMHAFDAGKVEGSIVVRMAQNDEELKLLDQSEAKLTDEFLVIADDVKALAVAGVIGGLDSGVTDNTQDIILESAYFDPATIMGKSRKLSVHTESGLRFERGVDWDLQVEALDRATDLITDICGGKVAPIHIEKVEEFIPKQQRISLSINRLKRVLGFGVDNDRVTQIFKALGLSCEFNGDEWTVETPTWRFDLGIAEDLIEEVVRVVGYDQMPSHRLVSTDAIRVIPEQIKQTNLIKQQLADLAYQEVINYSFVGEKQLSDLKLDDDAFALANPLNKEMAVMRTHLLPGMLANIKANLARQEYDMALFEMGKVFSKDNEIQQDDVLMMARTGRYTPEQWLEANDKVDFYSMKGDVESLLADVSETIEFYVSDKSYYHPGRQACIKSGDQILGYLGQVHPTICQKMKIKQEVYVSEFNVAGIQNVHLPAWEAVSKYPQVRRDLAIIIKDDINWSDVKEVTRKSLGSYESLLSKLSLFDVYKGDNIEKGYKSLAMAMIFQEKNRTLEDKEVDKLVSKAVSFLAEQLNAEIRS